MVTSLNQSAIPPIVGNTSTIQSEIPSSQARHGMSGYGSNKRIRSLTTDQESSYETWLMMYAKIGDSMGRRKLPRVRRCSGRRKWWTKVAGPYRTMKAARRSAKRLRDAKIYQGTLGIWKDDKKPNRKTSDWWVSLLTRSDDGESC